MARDNAANKLIAGKPGPDGEPAQITHDPEYSEILKLRQELDHYRSTAEEAQWKYRLLFDFAPSGLITLSSDHILKEINPKGCKILSCGTDQAIGRKFDDYIDEESKKSLQTFYRQVKSGINTEFCEVNLKGGEKGPKLVFVEGRNCIKSKDIILNIIDVSALELSALMLQQTRQNYETFFNSIEEFLYVMDLTGKIIYTNTTVLEKLGYTDQDISDLTFEKLHPVKMREAAIYRFHTMLEGKENHCDIPLADSSGMEIPVETRLTHGQWNGEPAVFAISKDMSVHKLAEQILRISETKYRTMLNASPDAILLLEMSGKISEISELGLELLGAGTRGNIIGKHINDFVPKQERYIIDDLIEKTISDGLTQNTEIVIKRPNKTLFSGELSSTLMQSSDGTPISFLLIVRDITQRKKAEAKQIHADRMANLGEMASGIAHEINQPLNIISMVLDAILYESSRKNEVQISFIKEKFERVFQNITRIRNIIDHIRAFSRSHDDYLLSPFSINASIENAVSMITEQFKHLGISLNLNLDRNIADIYGNTYKFEQVIVNLLVNAKDAVLEKKHSTREDYEMAITITSSISYKNVLVEVEDNGIGIREEDINNVILPFYTTKDESKGTGLGLSICYQIIREMNGTIDIISSRESGTKIRIIIDLKKQK